MSIVILDIKRSTLTQNPIRNMSFGKKVIVPNHPVCKLMIRYAREKDEFRIFFLYLAIVLIWNVIAIIFQSVCMRIKSIANVMNYSRKDKIRHADAELNLQQQQ